MKLLYILNQKNRILYQITISNITNVVLFIGLYAIYIIVRKEGNFESIESVYLLYTYIYLFIVLSINSVAIFNIEISNGAWTLLKLAKVPTYAYIIYVYSYCFLYIILTSYLLTMLLYINTVNYTTVIDTSIDIIILYILYNVVNIIILSIYNIINNIGIIYISIIPIFAVYIIIRQMIIIDPLFITNDDLIMLITISSLFIYLLVRLIVVKIKYGVKQ